VAGRVHQVQLIAVPFEPDRLRLDGDAALLLDLHIVEDLAMGHLAVGQAAGALDQPVGERRLPMVDMGDDREIADAGNVFHAAPLAVARECVSSLARPVQKW
jgi:hypothetical protein